MNMSADFWGVGAYNKWLNEVWNIFFMAILKSVKTISVILNDLVKTLYTIT